MTFFCVYFDGKQFYLLEHQEFREQAARIILDSYGKFVTETGARGFDEAAKKRSGKPVLRYLEQQMVQERSRK